MNLSTLTMKLSEIVGMPLSEDIVSGGLYDANLSAAEAAADSTTWPKIIFFAGRSCSF